MPLNIFVETTIYFFVRIAWLIERYLFKIEIYFNIISVFTAAFLFIYSILTKNNNLTDPKLLRTTIVYYKREQLDATGKMCLGRNYTVNKTTFKLIWVQGQSLRV